MYPACSFSTTELTRVAFSASRKLDTGGVGVLVGDIGGVGVRVGVNCGVGVRVGDGPTVGEGALPLVKVFVHCGVVFPPR